MHELHVWAKYGTIVAIPFTAYAPLTSGTRLTLISGATGPVTADITISKDGGAFAAATGTISNPGAGALYLYTASVADTQAQRIIVRLSDAAGAAYDDLTIYIETRLELSKLVADPRQMSGNEAGVEGFGLGSGHAFSGTAGASSKITNFLDTVLGAEVTSVYNAATSTQQELLQHLAARWFQKTSADSTSLTVYRADSSTVLETAGVSVASGVVTRGKFA